MWVLPSLNRVARVVALLDQARATGVSTPGVVILGPQDDLAAVERALPEGWSVRIQHRDDDCLTKVLNRYFRACPEMEWYGVLADDNWPVTPGWDRLLVEAALKTGIASCDDGWQAPKRMHSAWVLRGDVIRCAGFWQPPMCRHSFVDDFWEEIGRDFGLWTCLMDVRVEHRHPLKTGASLDETSRRQLVWLDRDREAFDNWQSSQSYAELIDRFKMLTASDDVIVKAKAALARAQSRKVMIATPVARSPALEYCMSFAETCVRLDRSGIAFATHFVTGSSNLPKARNELVARFLASDCTDLLFVDDDMGWRPEAVLRLLASEQPMIAGVGRKRVDKSNFDLDVWCVHFAPDAAESLAQDDMGAVEVVGVGTGFMRIRREVFEAMIAAHPEWKRAGHDGMAEKVRANYYAFFRFDPDDDKEMGEDFVFCQRWRELGGKVFIDRHIWLSHVGHKAWSGCINEMMTEVVPHDRRIEIDPRKPLEKAS